MYLLFLRLHCLQACKFFILNKYKSENNKIILSNRCKILLKYFTRYQYFFKLFIVGIIISKNEYDSNIYKSHICINGCHVENIKISKDSIILKKAKKYKLDVKTSFYFFW